MKLCKDIRNQSFLFMSFLFLTCAHPDRWIELSLLSSFTGLACVWLSLDYISCVSQKRWAFFGFTCVALFHLRWMVETNYHGVYIFFVWFVLALLIGAQYTLLTILVLSKQTIFSLKKVLLLSGFWIAAEISREFLFSGFPFASLSIALVNAPILLQMASLVGIYGMSGVLVLVNLLLYLSFKQKSFGYCFVFLTSYSLILIFGLIRLSYVESTISDNKYQIGLLQTGWAPEDKIDISNHKKPLSALEQWKQILSQSSVIKNLKLDLLVLPESAVSHGYSHVAGSFEEFKSLFKECLGYVLEKREGADLSVNNAFVAQSLSNCLNANVIIGLDFFNWESGNVFNSAFLFSPSSCKVHSYFKQVLVPMGEYLPMGFLRSVARRYGLHSFYTLGNKQGKFTAKKVQILPTICFEECFSHFFRNQVRDDTDLVINLTNDGWFLPSAFAKEHLYLSQFRAVENGRWIARSCNTGVTCVIDPCGKVKHMLPLIDQQNKLYQGLLLANIPLMKQQTVFHLFGDFLIRAFALICIVELLRNQLEITNVYARSKKYHLF